MNTIASSEGSLYELVSRGNKDEYFMKDLPTSKFIFDNSYEFQAPSTTELRSIPTRTASEFGRSVDFDLDLVGDIMTNPVIRITLPTWLPRQIAAQSQNSLITDVSGVSYGYTSGIAYFLFEQIQFYQDTILLQEFSGDALWANASIQGTYGHGFVTDILTGTHDGSPLSIARNGAPHTLRLELPLIGCQKGRGFPQRAVTSHTFRIRCKLRKLEDLIEASDGREKPTPWGQTFKIVTSQGGSPTFFTTLARSAIDPLKLELESRQVYTTREIQDDLCAKRLQIPYKRIYENIFTQGSKDYINVVAGGASFVNRRLDGCHPTGRLIWFFRGASDILANRLWKVNTNAGPYYNSVSLLIAGQTRETARDSLVWRDITNFAKEDLDSGTEINTMNWGLGSIAPLRFESQITGAVNFTTADKPTFYIDLAVPDGTSSELRVFVEGYTLYQIEKGRGEPFSLN